jgi:hypothetical protein
VISLNAARRDMTKTQRAMVAAKMANDRKGGDRKSDQSVNLRIDQEQAARSLGVSVRLVQAARFVLTNGSPEMIESCERGEQSVLDVERLIRKLQTAMIEGAQEAP